MRQPKYTCANCESEKEPYFSRSEPMGFYCADCGRDFDARDLQDAKATADFWIQKAKQSEQAAADLKAELADTKRHWREETEEQARLLGMSAERECDLRGKLERERALADRLAEALKSIWPFIEEDIPHGCNSTAYMTAIELCRENITAWKEARNEI